MKKNGHKIADLLLSYAENRCTDEEKDELFGLFHESGQESALKELLFEQLVELQDDRIKGHSIDSERLYNKILSEIEHREILETEKHLLRKRKKFGLVIRLVSGGVSIAAVFMLAFFLGSISDKSSGGAESALTAELASTEIKAPFGSTAELSLSDGTKVLINAGSSIRYRSDYNANNRDLVLEGEAYFKVARNTKLPLNVKTHNINIRATGTEFNVKAYSEEAVVETTLLEGEVEISQIDNSDSKQVLVLKPNEKAIYSEKSDQITLDNIRRAEPLAVRPPKIASDKLLVSPMTDVDEAIAWTENKLIIKGENLESLCIKLQRKYGVQFIFGDEEIKKFRFSGVLLDETFEQIMDAIKLTAPITYSVNGKAVTLVMNEKQIVKYSRK